MKSIAIIKKLFNSKGITKAKTEEIKKQNLLNIAAIISADDAQNKGELNFSIPIVGLAHAIDEWKFEGDNKTSHIYVMDVFEYLIKNELDNI